MIKCIVRWYLAAVDEVRDLLDVHEDAGVLQQLAPEPLPERLEEGEVELHAHHVLALPEEAPDPVPHVHREAVLLHHVVEPEIASTSIRHHEAASGSDIQSWLVRRQLQ